MKPAHYVSLPIAKQLAEAGILFPESEKVWTNGIVLAGESASGMTTFLEKQKSFRLDYRSNVDFKAGKDILIIPAPSLMEIMDELPAAIQTEKGSFGLSMDKTLTGYIFYFDNKGIYSIYSIAANTAPDAAAKIIIKLKESAGD